MEEAAFPQPSRTSPSARLHKSMGAVSLLWNNMFVPARYTSDINAEHFAIRTNAGLTDMTGDETPTELGLNFVVDSDDHSFRGKTACLEDWETPKIKAVGITFGSEVFELKKRNLLSIGR
jgi:glycine cleavage system aminomethyltransferase T